MKNYITYIRNFVIASLMIFSSCSDDPESFASDAAPGLGVTYTSENNFISFTKNPDETIIGDVDVFGKWFVKPEALLDRVVLMKSLLTSGNDEIERVLHDRDLAFNDSISFTINGTEELFEGFDTDINDLQVGSRFQFKPYGITPAADTIAIQGSAIFDAEYIAFCEKPQLELGTWVVTNNMTDYTKEVQLLWDDTYQMYVFTDFGIDWSWWNDFWYGTMFNLACPLIEGNPVEIELAGFGWDTTNEYEMLGDDGVTLETRRVRLMPYYYQEGSPKGYYDDSTGELVFKDVSVSDGWWGLDQHVFSMTFKKQ